MSYHITLYKRRLHFIHFRRQSKPSSLPCPETTHEHDRLYPIHLSGVFFLGFKLCWFSKSASIIFGREARSQFGSLDSSGEKQTQRWEMVNERVRKRVRERERLCFKSLQSHRHRQRHVWWLTSICMVFSYYRRVWMTLDSTTAYTVSSWLQTHSTEDLTPIPIWTLIDSCILKKGLLPGNIKKPGYHLPSWCVPNPKGTSQDSQSAHWETLVSNVTENKEIRGQPPRRATKIT